MEVGEQAIGEAGGMAHHLTDRRRPLRILQDHLAVRTDAGEDLHTCELRDEFRHRIIEDPVAFLEQDHHCRRGDRLGHRIDAEDGVRRQRRIPAQLGGAVGPERRHLAVTKDQGGDARHSSGLDHTRHIVIEPLQAVGVETQIFGPGGDRQAGELTHRSRLLVPWRVGDRSP
jgi:hypothetical protein